MSKKPAVEQKKVTTEQHGNKDKSLEQEIFEKEITSVEKQRLHRVFEIFIGKQQANEENKDDKVEENRQESFGVKEISRVMDMLGHQITKPEIEMMIWEVDENLDQQVDAYEFELMYKRCIFDKSGLEPRQLFNLVEFLMYDKLERCKISVEDTLELLYVKTKNYYEGGNLDDEIEAIFGNEEQTNDELEKRITYTEYLDKITKRAIEMRKRKEEEKKALKTTLKRE